MWLDRYWVQNRDSPYPVSLGVSGAEVLLAVAGEEPLHAGNPGAEQLVERLVTAGLVLGWGTRK